MIKVLWLLLFYSNFALADMEPTLIGGTPAEKGDFPEIVYISNGSARCSATVIGPQVILTAGHCVADQGSIKNVDFVVDQIVFNAKCAEAPQYRDHTEDLDFALCKTDRVIDVKYASVSKVGPRVGDSATLAGYGCIKKGGGGGNDGILRVGAAPVVSLPSGTNNWYGTDGASALCFGDSGGPSFVKVVSPKSDKHQVIGVNSRGDIDHVSYLTALWIDKSQKFFKDFASRNAVDICGITKECGVAAPPSPPKPQCDKLKRKLDKAAEELDAAKSKYDQCQKKSTTMEFPEGDDE